MFGKKDLDSGAAVTAALAAYKESYQASLRHGPNPQAAEAKALIHQAKKIASDSGLSRALVRVLLDEVKYWPSWSQRPEFRDYLNFDAQEVVATKADLGERKSESRIDFSYKGKRYGLVFHDLGWSYHDDAFHHGRVEFYADEKLVLGLNIADDMNPHYSQWNDFDLNALRLGEWTKALIEIEADIEQNKQRKRGSDENSAAIEKARNIEL
ncbi:hypothetical protein [Mesorhizobium neociceri]|uniref:Uncharacterized protein n=1 Tax=Mesorhizobium neociceri TaxID=1307853 RepID=A0A838BB08_9HYPH|nr:hypothetical protein [Mesorhizobium neociceri]MBA1143091.1 hypothetical protein [Mesorhizobium neociceri]